MRSLKVKILQVLGFRPYLTEVPKIFFLKNKQSKIKIKMTLKEQINADFMTAFKGKNVVAKGILSVVKGEIQTVEKNVGTDNLSDAEVTKILTKTVQSLKETITLSNDEKSKVELSVIEVYLPKQMSEAEVIAKLDEILASGVTNIGQIMKEFSQLPVDKKMVSEIAKKKMS